MEWAAAVKAAGEHWHGVSGAGGFASDPETMQRVVVVLRRQLEQSPPPPEPQFSRTPAPLPQRRP